MIKEYYRPQTLDEALSLLVQPDTLPLGGGTLLSKPGPAPIKVVDLQSLGLNSLSKKGNYLEVGATVTLQQLLESEYIPEALKTALKLEAPLNLRNAATIAGTLVSADGRSTFTTVLLAIDAKLTIVKPCFSANSSTLARNASLTGASNINDGIGNPICSRIKLINPPAI